ncbi:MAG: carboxypeptidase-like regulatory domain-containing protein [Prevotella sp.]|nr:carboxypeptidase-like regulatory domain-containing protein [Prevotella sp.]
MDLDNLGIDIMLVRIYLVNGIINLDRKPQVLIIKAMKFFVYLILFTLQFISSNAVAQIEFHGTVSAIENKEPIEGAIIQFGDKQSDYIVSDKNGKFSLPPKYNDILHIQCIGYKQVSILASKLLDNSIIELELSPIELNEIEISYIDANKLLEIAYHNTIKKMLTDLFLIYNAHIVISYNNDIDELNLSYTSLLKNNKLRRGKIPYELKLINIEQIYKGEQDLIKKNIISCEYHASEKLLNPKLLKDLHITIAQSDNDSLFIIKSKPKTINNISNNKTYHINRSDTTIRFIDVKFSDLELTKQKTMTYNGEKNILCTLRNQTGQVELRNNQDGKLYMYGLKHTVDCVVRYNNGEEANITYYIDSNYTNSIGNYKTKRKSLDGYTFGILSLLYTK